MTKNINHFIINLGLLVFGTAASFSGMLIQIKYHLGNHESIDINEFAFGINYQGWTVIHKFSIVVLSLLMIYHIYRHWKWYKGVITKGLIAKNQQVLIFSLLFIVVAATGLTSWFIDLLIGDQFQRKEFIEIHDKIAIIFSIYLVLHIIKRFKWFLNNFEKMTRKTKGLSFNFFSYFYL